MRVTSLTLTNFRGFASMTLELARPLTVLAGINGAGKSTVLEALSMLLGAAQVELLGRALVVPTLIPSDVRNGQGEARISARLSFAGADAEIAIEAERAGELVALAPARVRFSRDATVPREASMCLALHYGTARAASPDLHTRWKDGTAHATEPLDAVVGALAPDPLGFGDLFRWFRDREDYENAEKVRRGSLAWSDPQLDAVRAAIAALLPGFNGLRVDRAALRMVVEKGGDPLYLHQLSDGERTLLAVAADIARRLAIANPTAPDALACEAVVLLDEVELHLHPAWQRAVLGGLRRAFPQCQFIVTTHSPQILGEVPTEAVVLLADAHGYAPPAPTMGRDANSILSEVLGVAARPVAVAEALDAIRDLLDDGRIDDARRRIDDAAARLTERDPDVRALRTMIDVFDDQDAPHP